MVLKIKTKILQRDFKALPDLASAYSRALTLSCTCPLPFNLLAVFYFLLPQDFPQAIASP